MLRSKTKTLALVIQTLESSSIQCLDQPQQLFLGIMKPLNPRIY